MLIGDKVEVDAAEIVLITSSASVELGADATV